ncbi:flagellar hook-associated protein FlgK [Paenibacillus sp. KN14-4R]|uniref:flagellar hook-associated protein FlgK n=1 Tax=Paenibacillus sp. KN14-4R TaxID=3445773 RepID=UPI003FA18F43
MRSTFTGLEISKRSLFTQQAALQTTGHNISNVNTRGFSRQVVNMVASTPLEAYGMMRSTVPGQMGQGVEFDHINRIRDQFLDHQFYNENKGLGEWSTKKLALEKLENIVNEPSDSGIRQVIQNFWNSWQELSKAPENLSARAVVKESALAMTEAFNHTATQLKDFERDLSDNITVKATQINSMLREVASLNKEIYRIEGLGDHANDLRDQRDVVMDDLSKIINIEMMEDSTGYNITMGGVELLNSANEQPEVNVTSDFLVGNAQGGALKSGEVYGLVYSRDTLVKSYRDQIDNMVKTFVGGDIKVTLPAGSVLPKGVVIDGVSGTLTKDTEVTVKGFNQLHQLGYTGEKTLSQGGLFFTMKPGATEITAESITVNPAIVADVGKIASSMRTYMDGGVEKVVTGNNSLALLMAGMKDKKFDYDPTGSGTAVLNAGTLDEYLRSVVGSIGVLSQEAKRQTANQDLLVQQIESYRQSVSGVSLDEEMSNLIKFQHAYNAAARAMTTYDQVLDKVINSMGIVGR